MSAPLSKIKNYPDFLAQCWEKHLLPKEADAPAFISTFAGTGGSSLGYSMAGFRELLAVEMDKHAVKNFRLNFADVPVFADDIKNLSVDRIFDLTGIKEGELSLFDGSPPCQGFSQAGKRQMTDDRNFLFREFVRLLKGLMPKVLVMENVSGMVKGKMKLFFAEIIRELKAAGYRVKASLFNTKYFGVPQSRERIIFIGVRNDLEIEPSFPSAKYRAINLREAVEGIDSVGVPLSGKIREIGKYAIPGEYFSTTNQRLGNNSTAHFSTVKLQWDKTCPTITKTMRENLAGLVHPDENNMLSIAAIKRCGSFPDEVKLVGPNREQWARVGNSVPPLFMMHIAEHIKANILNSL